VRDGEKIKGLPVAGSIDLLMHDEQGNFYIYDIKTHRGKITNEKKHHWSLQISLYKRFLEEKYGITVSNTYIIPVKVHYPAPEGTRDSEGEGHARYEETEGSNQILMDGKPFKDAQPHLEDIITIQPAKKIPIEYSNIGYNKKFAKVADTSEYTQISLFDALKIKQVYGDNSEIKQMYLPEGVLNLDGSVLNKDEIGRQI